jgi:diketogulonate reductase-like aldo/keto reductase
MCTSNLLEGTLSRRFVILLFSFFLNSVTPTIVIKSDLNEQVSGVYVRGVTLNNEKAYAKAATSEENERLDLWLYYLDHGADGVRWMVGENPGSDSAHTYADTWSFEDPCGTRNDGDTPWLFFQDGHWQHDPTLTVECHGLEPGGIDSCDSNNSSVPCVDLLGNGRQGQTVPMPMIMLGTAYISASHGAGAQNPEVVEPPPAIEMAIDMGYQGLDLGSQMHPAYANERAVGDLLAQRPGRRKSLFLTTKLSPNEHGYESTLRAVQRSLQLLRTDTIDLFLIHHPSCLMTDECEGDWRDSWRAMERLLGLGAVRAHMLGDPAAMDNWKGMTKATVSLVQNRADPLALEDPKLLRLCQAHGIQYQAFSVLGRQWVVGPWSDYWKAPAHPILGHPSVEKIAARLSAETQTAVGPAQVVLRWAIEKGWTVVPKTAKKSRLESNRQVFHFSLTDLDMGILDNLKAPPKTGEEF